MKSASSRWTSEPLPHFLSEPSFALRTSRPALRAAFFGLLSEVLGVGYLLLLRLLGLLGLVLGGGLLLLALGDGLASLLILQLGGALSGTPAVSGLLLGVGA